MKNTIHFSSPGERMHFLKHGFEEIIPQEVKAEPIAEEKPKKKRAKKKEKKDDTVQAE